MYNKASRPGSGERDQGGAVYWKKEQGRHERHQEESYSVPLLDDRRFPTKRPPVTVLCLSPELLVAIPVLLALLALLSSDINPLTLSLPSPTLLGARPVYLRSCTFPLLRFSPPRAVISQRGHFVFSRSSSSMLSFSLPPPLLVVLPQQTSTLPCITLGSFSSFHIG